MVKVGLIYRSKMIYPDGAIREMVIWQLPRKSHGRPQGIKYRLYYGDGRGKCLVHYDNETGKGDHKHIGGKEKDYHFSTVEKLVAGFQEEINRFRRSK